MLLDISAAFFFEADVSEAHLSVSSREVGGWGGVGG